jgi:hypothetical protein
LAAFGAQNQKAQNTAYQFDVSQDSGGLKAGNLTPPPEYGRMGTN